MKIKSCPPFSTATVSFDILNKNILKIRKVNCKNIQIIIKLWKVKKILPDDIKTYGSAAPKSRARHQAFVTLMNSITF